MQEGTSQAAASGPPPPDSATLVEQGNAAAIRGDWAEARARFASALELEQSPPALEGYALASWWEDDIKAAIDSRERAYTMRREAGEDREAARLAGFLAWDYATQRGRRAIANGWLERARHLTEDLPPAAEHAWLTLIEASFHLDTDPEAVRRLSAEAAEHAKSFGGLDIEMTARTLNGLALVSLGDISDGMRLLDEGVAAATAGELHDPIAIGSCCCNLIIACVRVRDYDRAAQWCDQLAGYCEKTGQRPLLALCRAHHGTVETVRGNWDAAEEDLGWATGELSTLRPALAGYARTRFAELRRRQGRHDDARELLSEADAHVLVPLVRAELALDEGDLEAVLSHADTFMRGLGSDQSIERAAALELIVPASAQGGDVDRARRDHEALRAIAAEVNTDPARAGERVAGGSLAVAEGDLDRSRPLFEDAIELYRRCGLPYELGRTRLAMGRTLVTAGRRDSALEQVRTAYAAFDQLGAERDLAQAARLLGRIEGGKEEAAGLTRREVEVLGLVAEGLSNRDIAQRLVVSEHTVHRHVANIFVKLGVSSRAAAVTAATQLDVLG